MPRIRIAPEGGAWTDGPDAAELCAEYWFEPDPWQRDILDCWLTRDEYGRLLATTVGLSVPRQNGKNGVVEALEFYLLLTDGDTHILHTAHQVKTAKKAFERLSRALTQNADPEIRAMVAKVRSTNGQEGIFLTNGASIEYVARSRGSGRGFDNITLIVYDEAQELQAEHVDALLFTLAASKGDRLVIYLGTPPKPDSPADVFRMRRRKFIDSPGPHTCYHEWGVTDVPARDASFEDLLDAVYETNPAMGVRLDEEYTREEFDNTTVDGFARERLGWWQEYGVAACPIPAKKWEACATEAPPADGKRCFAVKFSPDGEVGTLSVCVRPKVGAPHVECICNRSTQDGIGWFADWLLDARPVASLVVIDGKANAQPLHQALILGRPPTKPVTWDDEEWDRYGGRALHLARPGDLADACSMFVNAVKEGAVTHFGQPALSESATGCAKRPIGSSGGFGFGPGAREVDATLVESAALAYWACMTTKRDASRKGEVG